MQSLESRPWLSPDALKGLSDLRKNYRLDHNRQKKSTYDSSRRVFLRRAVLAGLAATLGVSYQTFPLDIVNLQAEESGVIKDLGQSVDIGQLLDHKKVIWSPLPQYNYSLKADMGEFAMDGLVGWEKIALINQSNARKPGIELGSLFGKGKSELTTSAFLLTLPKSGPVYLVSEMEISNLYSGRAGISFGSYSLSESNKYLLSLFAIKEGLFFSYYDGAEAGGGKLYKGIKYAEIPSTSPLVIQSGIKVGVNGEIQLISGDGRLFQIPELPRLIKNGGALYGQRSIDFGVWQEGETQASVPKLFKIQQKQAIK